MAGAGFEFVREQLSIKQEPSNEEVFNVDVALIILEQLKEELEFSVAQTRTCMEKLIPPEDLSGNAKQELEVVSEYLQSLDVIDKNEIDTVLQNTRIMVEEARLKRRRLQLQNKIWQLSKYKERLEGLRRNAWKINSDFKEEIEEKGIETQFLQHELDECRKNYEKLKAEVQSLGISEHHKVTQERIKEITALQEECETIKLKLKKYENLPPDLVKARETLSKVRNDHEHAQQQLKNQIGKQASRVFGSMK